VGSQAKGDVMTRYWCKLLFKVLVLFSLSLPAFAADLAKESGYDRVMRTHTLRCAYILGIAPEMLKDPNTGVLSGIAYDIAEEAGRRLGLKIEWTEEVGFQTMITGLQTERYDAVCFTLYRDTRRSPVADFTVPMFYNSQGTFVRVSNVGFDRDITSINNPAVTVATVDGEMSQFIAAEDFPRAKTFSMPQSTDLSQMMESVATGKADVAFVNALVAQGYMKNNPGKLREIHADHPVRVFSHGFMFAKGQYDLVKMIDLAVEEMLDQGAIGKILDKYDPVGKAYQRIAKPYELPHGSNNGGDKTK
jgi:polar amino acid transport system substrate-binding protein